MSVAEDGEPGRWTVRDSTQVWFRGAGLAGDHDDTLGRRRYAAPGPPVPASELAGPVRAALVAALLLEGEADTPDAAERLIHSDAVDLVPGYDTRVAVPLAAVVSPSMPVLVVADDDGRPMLGPIDASMGRAVRFGCHDARVVEQLRQIATEVVPLLDDTVAASPLNVTRTMTESLRRGDDCHARTVAGTSMMIASVLAALVARDESGRSLRLARWLQVQPHLFGALTASAARLLLEQKASPETLTAIGSNGVEIGIRTAGTGERWFTAPAPVGHAVVGGGHHLEDVHPVIGDSFAVEAIGLGAHALPAGPVTAEILGLGEAHVESVAHHAVDVATSRSGRFRIPRFGGTAAGIDVTAVARSGRGLSILTGLVGREPGVGQIAAGLAEVPIETFDAAADALLTAGAVAPGT